MRQATSQNRQKLTIMVVAVYVLAMVAFAPLRVIAQETSTEGAGTSSQEGSTLPAETTQTQSSTTGPDAPTGPERSTYVFNPATGLWENDYFTWNPVTKKTAPKQQNTYSYNPSTGLWDTTEYVFHPETGKYQPNIISKKVTPQGATIENTGPNSNNKLDNANGSVTNTGPNSDNTIKNTNGSIDQTGPGSENHILDVSSSSGTFDLYFNAQISNTVNANAVSGDASVLHNTTGGSATTGDAVVDATILNMIQSGWGFGNNTPKLYSATIQGDYLGDIMIDPAQFAGGMSTSVPGYDDLVVNATVDASINNDINLDARSGSARVSGNTTGGNATTGDADAIANIVNMITSSISAGQSFLGVLNINGNFDGDVLIPDGVIDQLIARNYPTASVACACDHGDSSLTINNDNDQTINNNIVTNANSGSADVTNNTTGGNATTGSASTNVTVLNLTGSNVIAENALLVFVNVLGEWIGMIVNAPGATSAALVGGAGGNGVSTLLPGSGDAEYNIDNDFEINNNVNINSTSGDAEVSNNTSGGNATTGDATASANIANITNSNFALGGWFGVLFINVLGDWHGSFGEDTAYGNPVPTPPVLPGSTKNTGGSSSSAGVASNSAVTGVAVFHVTGNGSSLSLSSATGASTETNDSSAVAGASEKMGTTAFESKVQDAASELAESTSNGLQLGWLILMGATVLGVVFRDRLLLFLRPPSA